MHDLTREELEKREIVYIDIVNDPLYSSRDYKAEFDPTKFKSSKTGRGPLIGKQWWQKMGDVPVMCAYKLVTVHFKWFGLQSTVESMIIKVRICLNVRGKFFKGTVIDMRLLRNVTIA